MLLNFLYSVINSIIRFTDSADLFITTKAIDSKRYSDDKGIDEEIKKFFENYKLMIKHVPTTFAFAESEVIRIPNCLNKCPTIQYIYLGSNKITHVPNDFGIGLVNLQELYLYENFLKFLPSQFGLTLTKLETLWLSKNELEYLPIDFGSNLRTLKELFLTKNKLKSLPLGFGRELTKLEVLCLDFNQLESLPDSFISFIDNSDPNNRSLKGFVSLKKLAIGSNNLTSLPENFGIGLNNLHSLCLKKNHLKKLPDSFGEGLSNLKTIDLSNNKLDSLPKDFGIHLNKIEEIFLGSNNLRRLPKSFLKLKKTLNYLDLSENDDFAEDDDDFNLGIRSLKLLLPETQIVFSEKTRFGMRIKL